MEAKAFLIKLVRDRQVWVPDLLDVWEASVRVSHDFLDEAAIQAIKEEVPAALLAVDHLVLVRSAVGETAGFMGLVGDRLEMLFVHPSYSGDGLGRALLTIGISSHGLNRLTVNEQNAQAVAFYQHMGFVTYRRTEVDEEGRPYPLLYMRYEGQEISDIFGTRTEDA